MMDHKHGKGRPSYNRRFEIAAHGRLFFLDYHT